MSKSNEGAGVLAYVSSKSDVEVDGQVYGVTGLSLTAVATIIKEHLGVIKDLVAEHKGGDDKAIDYANVVTTAPEMVAKLIATALGHPDAHVDVYNTWPAGLQIIVFGKVVEETAVDLDQLGKLVGSLLAMFGVEEITQPIEGAQDKEAKEDTGG